MAKYQVTIYPVTPWTIVVEAKSAKEAKKIALDLEGPSEPMMCDESEWNHEILEWPNIGINGQIDIEKL